MKFTKLINKLEKFTCDYDLDKVDVTCNKINGVAVLIFKFDGMVFDCIVLGDTRFEAPTYYENMEICEARH